MRQGRLAGLALRVFAVGFVLVGRPVSVPAQRYGQAYWVERQFEAQEKHLDSSDKQIQKDVEELQREHEDLEKLTVRMEGDEDYIKGGGALLAGLISLFGLVRSMQKKQA